METAMSKQTRVHGAQRPTASEFLITVNRLQISLMIRDPLMVAFRGDEDTVLAETDHPMTLDSGSPEVVGDTGRQISVMVEG
jgi:hypothetical protein